MAQAVVTVAEELGVDVRPMGATTYRRRELDKGFEADASFYFQNDRFVRDPAEVDPTVDPPLDLVIEIDVSHPSLDKLPIYAGWACRRSGAARPIGSRSSCSRATGTARCGPAWLYRP